MEFVPPSRRGTLVAGNGVHLYKQVHYPETSPEALVLLVHGYGVHCGRHGAIVEALTAENATVYGYDQRGHGRSGGKRAYIESFDLLLDDLTTVIRSIRADEPELPLFVFGHSMGGLVVLKYALERTNDIRGLLLSAPALEINPDLAPVLRRLSQLLGRIAPTLPTVRSPEGAISRDPAVVEAAENDPLNYHGRVLARTGAEMLEAGAAVRTRLHEVRTPFLVTHGTADTLTSPRWSKKLYQKAEATDKTLRLYHGLYHETYNEPEKNEVLSDLAAWVRDRIH